MIRVEGGVPIVGMVWWAIGFKTESKLFLCVRSIKWLER